MATAKTYRLALAEVQRKYPEISGSDLDEAVDELIQDWAAEDAHDREVYGDPEDTFSLEGHHCDDWGTGEGRFHGRI